MSIKGALRILLVFVATMHYGCTQNQSPRVRTLRKTVLFQHGQIFFNSKSFEPSSLDNHDAAKAASPEERSKIESYLSYLSKEIFSTEKRHHFHGLQLTNLHPDQFKIQVVAASNAGPHVTCEEQAVSIPLNFLEEIYLDAVNYSIKSSDYSYFLPADKLNSRDFLETFLNPIPRKEIPSAKLKARLLLSTLMSIRNPANLFTDEGFDEFLSKSLRVESLFDIQKSSEREYLKSINFVLAHELAHIWFHCASKDLFSAADEEFADRFGVLISFEQFIHKCSWETPIFSLYQEHRPSDLQLREIIMGAAAGEYEPHSIPHQERINLNIQSISSELLLIFDTTLRERVTQILVDKSKNDPEDLKPYARDYIKERLAAGGSINIYDLVQLSLRNESEHYSAAETQIDGIHYLLIGLESELEKDPETISNINKFQDKYKDYQSISEKESTDRGTSNPSTPSSPALPITSLFGDRDSAFGRDGIELALGIYKNTSKETGDSVHLPIEVRMQQIALLSNTVSSALLNGAESQLRKSLRESWFGIFSEEPLRNKSFRLTYPLGCPDWSLEIGDNDSEAGNVFH